MLQENPQSENIIPGKILVTGGSGLIGKELITQLLDNGENIRATYHSTPISISHPKLELIQCDILDVVTLEESMANARILLEHATENVMRAFLAGRQSEHHHYKPRKQK